MQIDIPDWLITTKTILIAKSEETSNEQNYRPIAIQNSMYKIYVGMLAEFVMEHCTRTGIITEEQAAGKRGSWGCVDQLSVNKMIYREVKERRRNLITVWLDYKKDSDSVPHAWIIKSLELAKIPKLIIDAIRILMTKWRTKLHLYAYIGKSSFIDYLRGILQEDLLSLILFVLSVNPLSYLSTKEKGYTINITAKAKRNFTPVFVDDLKLYASSLNKIMKLLDIVT